MLKEMIDRLLNELNFDFNNPSYKKLDETLSKQVRTIYKEFADRCNLDPTKPIYSKNGILIANSFDRIVIGDYGPYIEFTKEQSHCTEFVVATGQEYRLTERYNKTIKYEWYSTKKQDCKLYWQLRGVVYADYKPQRYYVSPFEVVQNQLDNKIASKKKIARIIIAGGRKFNDYKLLKNKVDFYLSDLVNKNYIIEIVTGKATGADSLGEKYALEKEYKIAEFPPDWNKYGKRAGYIRNAEMARYASKENGALIAFWDTKSKGTKHMIDLAKEKNLAIRIVKY